MTLETITEIGPDTDDGAPALPTLSPSRAADFKTCPLLYRFRTVDKLPERPTVDQARGTLVHAVLERLFDLPAPARTPQAAADLVAPEWRRLLAEHPDLGEVCAAEASRGEAAGAGPQAGPVDPARFLESARDLLAGYFAVEDPRRLEPAEREYFVQSVIDDQLLIRGYVDRLDVSPAGDLRVVDYKTGGAPREAFEARALFQLKFYALVLWRARGTVPRVLRLLYLRDAEACDYTPDAEELLRFERTLLALWQAIAQATAARDFRPKPSRLCGWCAHQDKCPAFGGTPPPYPEATAPHDGASAAPGGMPAAPGDTEPPTPVAAGGAPPPAG
ncbi:MAG: PD-(D/E)XK nuclease family protein [Micromonosporaceae bacterium]